VAWAFSKSGVPAVGVVYAGGAAMLSGWIGACGCMACAALLESPSVPAAIGLPDCAPELKF
jgi:hypothetical protein